MIDILTIEAEENGLIVEESALMPRKLKGILIDNEIYVNKFLSKAEKIVVLREEIEHYKFNVGKIIDVRDLSNLKQELLARWSTYEKLLTLESIISAIEYGVSNVFEFSEYLELPEEFVVEGINYYKQRYKKIKYREYIIDFRGPLRLLKTEEEEYIMDIKWKDMIGDIINADDEKIKIKRANGNIIRFNKSDVYRVKVDDARMLIEFINFQYETIGDIFIPTDKLKDAVLIFNDYDKTGKLYEPKSVTFYSKGFYKGFLVKKKRIALQVPVPEKPAIPVRNKLVFYVAGVNFQDDNGNDIQENIHKYIKNNHYTNNFEEWSNKEIIEYDAEIYEFELSEVDTVKFVQDSNNEHDPNAIKIVHDSMGKIGFVPIKYQKQYNDFINKHEDYKIEIAFTGGRQKYVDFKEDGYEEKVYMKSTPYYIDIELVEK